MKKKNKVILVQRIFTNYRQPVFDKLAEAYDLLVIHSKDNSGIKQVKTAYSKEVKKIRFGSDSRLFLFMAGEILKFKPDVIIHEFSVGIISLILVYIIARMRGIKLILWSHGYNRKKGFNPAKSVQDKIRLIYVKSADALLLYGDKDRELFSKYIDSKKIFVAKNTFDTAKLVSVYNKNLKTGRDKVKERLGFKHQYNLIFIGRLIRSKRPELLIDIYEKISLKLKNKPGIHFIGGGESKSDLESSVKIKGYENDFYFHGSVYDDDAVGELLFSSDIMVMPGECGLSIVHAFCFMCPVITYKGNDDKGPFHGPEIEYIVHNDTGFLIPRDDIELMSQTIIDYLSSPEKQDRFRKNIALMLDHDLSVDNMLKGFYESINYCIDNCKNN